MEKLSIDCTTAKEGQDLPKIGSLWKHTNGNTYQVLGYTNLESERHAEYPPSVTYYNIDTGATWSRSIQRWYSGSLTEQKITPSTHMEFLDQNLITIIKEIVDFKNTGILQGDTFLTFRKMVKEQLAAPHELGTNEADAIANSLIVDRAFSIILSKIEVTICNP